MSPLFCLSDHVRYYNKHLLQEFPPNILLFKLRVAAMNCILFDESTDKSRRFLCESKKLIEDNLNCWNNQIKMLDIHITNKFNSDLKDINVVSRSFYKMQEIITTFELISKLPSNLTRLHLAESPGGFIINSNLNFKSDNYLTISLEPSNKHIPRYHSSVDMHKQIKITNNDITNWRVINTMIKRYSNSFDLITGDGGLLVADYSHQEELSSRLIASELYISLHCLKKDGVLVLKFFESYTNYTKTLLQIIYENFQKTYIYKPESSRPTNSEKYVVALSFKGPKWTNELVKLLFGLPSTFKSKLKVRRNINIANNVLANIQAKAIVSTLIKASK